MNNLKKYILAAVIIIGISAFIFVKRQNTVVLESTPTPEPSTTISEYTLADVAQHDTITSCWATVNGRVYDLTQWIGMHPGGPEKIMSICGTDGSRLFNQQHGDKGQPNAVLGRYFIGILVQ